MAGGMTTTRLPLVSALAAAIWLEGPAAASAAKDACGPPETRAAISFVEDNAAVRIDHSLDGDTIAALSGQRAPIRSAPRRRITGLTSTEFEYEYDVGMAYRQVRPDVACVWLRSVNLRLGYTRTTIYIDRRYRRGSCAFDAVLEHENEHVAINNRTFRQFLPRLRRGLERALAANPVIAVRDERAARRAYGSIIDRALEPHLARFETVRKRQHAELDSPASYDALQDCCADW